MGSFSISKIVFTKYMTIDVISQLNVKQYCKVRVFIILMPSKMYEEV